MEKLHTQHTQKEINQWILSQNHSTPWIFHYILPKLSNCQHSGRHTLWYPLPFAKRWSVDQIDLVQSPSMWWSSQHEQGGWTCLNCFETGSRKMTLQPVCAKISLIILLSLGDIQRSDYLHPDMMTGTLSTPNSATGSESNWTKAKIRYLRLFLDRCICIWQEVTFLDL